MRRKNIPFKGRRYLIDTNPLTKVIHDLDAEKRSCNLNKVIIPHVKMLDTMSNVNFYRLFNSDYEFCKACFKENDKIV